MKRAVVLTLAVGALALAGCGDNGSDSSGGAGASASKAIDNATSAALDARDSGFLAALRAGNLTFGDDGKMVDTAKQACSDFKDGKSATDVRGSVGQSSGLDADKSRNFIRIAVPAYCADQVTKLFDF
ncbi:DUF732 domain-containing protein [Williamsia sterculiae]|uniref:DUF732 domain-containing protein n=1 Tax=Williamsia sterculiae TaxID=1344003 RepID=A0A1N7CL52_9NOCA|nr:DUF732 domain-containing protein [Williamsia sterculiae]SIR64309.1 Protein of unknown function [Williamsia sterculiae]